MSQSKLERARDLCAPWAENLGQAAKLYTQRYPLDKTPHAVLDAVTVPIPYIAFLALITALDAVTSNPAAVPNSIDGELT